MDVKLTEYIKSSGYGYNAQPDLLKGMLENLTPQQKQAGVFFGCKWKDDVTVTAIGNGRAEVSTIDFFTPIVDDAFDFGRISAATVLSDVYAIGAKPMTAMAMFGWPENVLKPAVAHKIMQGALFACNQAGVTLAGDYIMPYSEPVFGLAITGTAQQEHIKQNNTPQPGDALFLTKPIGNGILATALKKGKLCAAHYPLLIENMALPNCCGEKLGSLKYVTAMTHVSGLALVGHLANMLGNAEISAELWWDKIPKLEYAEEYISRFLYPDATTRIYDTYKNEVEWQGGLEFLLLCDPQVSGGLLFSVASEQVNEMQKWIENEGIAAWNIGTVTPRQKKKIVVL